ncbi:MAG: phosphate ABC transporter permease PstA [Eubacterium sp.]|nr:phosphate ABC transporter permease PstA [Eubacterium sp.]
MTKVQTDESIIKKNQIKAGVLKAVTIFAAVLTVLVLGFLIVYILVKGVPHLTPELFAWEYNSENVSMLPAIINTLEMTVLTLLVAIPFGIGSAIYLVEYASSKNRFVPVVRMTAETLTGIPSIVYGLFGMLFFNSLFGISMLSGALTLAIMVLPVIMRTTEEALLAVPKNYREGSFGLGAGKLRTIFKIVLPAAMPGIFSGIVLSIGRIVGETAALIYTAGTFTKAASSVFNSGRTLSVHMYLLSKEGLNTDQAYATAVVLLVLVIIINFISGRIASGVQKQHGEA